MKSFYKQSSACVRVAGNESNFHCEPRVEVRRCDVSMAAQYLRERSSRRGLRNDAGESGQEY